MTKEEMIKWLENLKEDIGRPRYEALWHYEQALDEVIEALKQESVKHGYWEEECNGNGWNDYWDYTCSMCGKKYKNADDILYESNFCPNCGAKMKRRE